jgi:CheY-like chemotaxis protein/HPt (histidine-containing phosphotransfer) domain-containing protein
MDGLAVTKLIKQDAEISDTKIVLLSSDSDPDDEIRKAGIERYLVKPARQSDIYNVVLQLTGVYVPENNKREGLTGSVFIGAHVLLVDDMSTNQEVGVEMLRELGIEADIASDGQEAIDAVVLHNYDLVLMDCQMPVIDGYAATEIIRAQEQARNSKHVPIIALTAHAMEGDRDACIDAGMDDYLSKPFTLDDLRRILTRWVPQYRQNEAELASEDPDQLPGEKQTDGYKKLETMFDTAALDKLYKLVGEKFSHLVDLFEKDANKILPVLKKAAKDNDTEAVCKSAHALKGVSMNMAAIQIAELCKTLEKQAREEKLTDPLAQIKSISQKLKSAIRALRNLD